MSGKRVLIIDEDVEVRRSVRAALVNSGWQVEEAVDGLSGLESIRKANADGAGFCCLLIEAFLPDWDGKLMLATLRAQFPKLPLIVATAYGDEEQQKFVDSLKPAVYLEKPVAMESLLQVLEQFDWRITTEELATLPEAKERQCEAYIFVRIKDNEHAADILMNFRATEGIRIANAVRGEYDIILRLAVKSLTQLNELIDKIKLTSGITVLAVEKIDKPLLTREVEGFLAHYDAVSAEHRAAYHAMHETNAYLMIDLDRYQLEKIYSSIVMTEGVISCQVSSGGSKLTVFMSGALRPNVLRHVLQKLAAMDGIRRVREATVINIAG